MFAENRKLNKSLRFIRSDHLHTQVFSCFFYIFVQLLFRFDVKTLVIDFIHKFQWL